MKLFLIKKINRSVLAVLTAQQCIVRRGHITQSHKTVML